eukprot:206105-Pyramimonas_sp.AAC.1
MFAPGPLQEVLAAPAHAALPPPVSMSAMGHRHGSGGERGALRKLCSSEHGAAGRTPQATEGSKANR